MKKIIGILVCMLMLMIVMPIASSSDNSNIEIDIFAGTRHMWIGNGVGFSVRNNGKESITVSITCDMDYYFQGSKSINLEITVEPGDFEQGNFGVLDGFKRICVSAQFGEITHYRSGFSFGQLIIFLSNSPF
jgi:hypothetical protein